MRPHATYETLAEHVLDVWNTQEIDDVVACYTSDLVYLDPNTRGPVVGTDEMRAYLARLFGRWTMTWRALEIFPLAGQDGVTIMWSATLAPVGETRSVDVDGVDLVLLEGDLIKRNQVYFDRARLAELLTPLPG